MLAAFRLVVQPFLAILAAAALAAPPEAELPAVPRAVVASGDLALACLAQGGLAVASIDAGTSTGLRVDVVVPIPTLHAVVIDGTRALLAGREGYLVLLDLSDRSAPREIDRWPQEGIPVHLAYDGVRLRVAAGPAGMQILDWIDPTAAPVLRGRYAFCDFMKQTATGTGTIVFAADNFDGGVQGIDTSDPERPRRVFGKVVGDFIDSVAVSEDVAVAGARRRGWYFFEGSGKNRDPLGMLPLPPVKGAEAEAVVALPGRRVVLAERAAGARVVRLGPASDPAAITEEGRLEGHAVVSAAALPDGRLLLGTEGPGLLLWDGKSLPAGS
jgi:hypothetical protein